MLRAIFIAFLAFSLTTFAADWQGGRECKVHVLVKSEKVECNFGILAVIW